MCEDCPRVYATISISPMPIVLFLPRLLLIFPFSNTIRILLERYIASQFKIKIIVTIDISGKIGIKLLTSLIFRCRLYSPKLSADYQ